MKGLFASIKTMIEEVPAGMVDRIWRTEWLHKFETFGMTREEAAKYIDQTLQDEFLRLAKGEKEWWRDD